MKPADALPIVRAKRGGFAASLIMGFIDVESAFNECAFRADRRGGSYGLMQVTVPTARDMGFKGDARGLFDPATNVALGVAYLAWAKKYLASRSVGGKAAMIAAYNEGVGNVVRGFPDVHYVGLVNAAAEKWRIALGEGVS